MLNLILIALLMTVGCGIGCATDPASARSEKATTSSAVVTAQSAVMASAVTVAECCETNAVGCSWWSSVGCP